MTAALAVTGLATAAPRTAPTVPTPMTLPKTTPTTGKPWAIDFILLAAIWGASFLFMRIGVREFGALPTAGVRVGIGMAFLLPLMAMRGLSGEFAQTWRRSALVGVLNSAIPFACFSYALLTLSTGLSSLLNATVPLFGALVAWVWLKDRPTKSRLLGLVIGFAGVAALAWNKSSFTPDASGNNSGWAVLVVLLACLCYGIAASYTKRFLTGVPPLVTASGSQLGASLFLLIPTLWLWPAKPPSLAAWGALVALGLLCTGVAYVLYFRLIERAGPARAMTVTFVIPMFAILYGVTLLGEAVTGSMLVCGVVIICGTLLSTGLVRFSRR